MKRETCLRERKKTERITKKETEKRQTNRQIHKKQTEIGEMLRDRDIKTNKKQIDRDR